MKMNDSVKVVGYVVVKKRIINIFIYLDVC